MQLETVRTITSQELASRLAQGDNLLLLDVREPEEIEICSIAGSMNIPMKMIPICLDQIPDEQEIVIYCHHGVRSLSVANYLIAAGFDAQYLYNLDGGINHWANEVDLSMAKY